MKYSHSVKKRWVACQMQLALAARSEEERRRLELCVQCQRVVVAHATFRFSAPFDCDAAACVGVEQRCLHLVTVPQPRRRRRCCCYGGPAALSNSDGLECSEALGKRGSFLAK